MWQCPDELEDEANVPSESAPVVAEDGPNTELVLELVSDYVQSTLFSTLARVNKHFAAKARARFDAFLDRLTATSQRLGKRSAERTKAFWKENRTSRGITAVTYEDRCEWHWNKFAGLRGEGTCSSAYHHTIPTRDQTFSDQTRDNISSELARAMKPCHIIRSGNATLGSSATCARPCS